ncbi:DUF2381 family protein [Corallococcus interemptor]|uniref:DUF2381 family protein n=1 Tax=Corallococcus interemptor TaxID=2316720 RepID=A0A3A8QZK9_9BACT|nr:DUF2381 family protein [Corallococcus interemptor]RKH68574.1 DUF2381 family protein [Corallococcus interemptor]
MPSCLFAVLPVLLWSSHVLAASPFEKEAREGTLRMEVGTEDTGTRPIRIGPGVSTTLLFDTDIQQEQVSLESRAQFARVSMGSSVLVLVPSNDLQPGTTLSLSIPFKDAGSTLPSRLSLRLVVDSGAVDRQVEIYRRARSAESYRQEVLQLRAELERLRREHVSPAAGTREQTGFRGLLMDSTGFPGVSVERTARPWSCRRPCSLLINKSSSYLSGSRRAVKVWVTAVDKKPWTIGRAVLVDRQGKEWESLPPAQPGPITSESEATLILEFDVKSPDLDGYQLKVLDVDGARTAQWSGISFP